MGDTLRCVRMDRIEFENGPAEEVGSEALLSVGLLSGLLPVAGGEVDKAAFGPTGQQAEQIAQVAFGLDAVHVATCNERRASGVDLGTVVTADKQPIRSPDRLPAELTFGDVVRGGEPTIIEETSERVLLVEGVADGCGQWGAVECRSLVLSTQFEVAIDEGFDLGCSHALSLLARLICKLALEQEHHAQIAEELLGDLRLTTEHLEKVGARVAPTGDLGRVAITIQVVVDGMGIGDDMSGVVAEQGVDGRTVVVVAEREQDVSFGHDKHPEMASGALFGCLDQHANCWKPLPHVPDPSAKRYQQTEVPPIEPFTTEWRRHEVTCPCCKYRTRASYVDGEIPVSPFGPRLMAIVALLTGVYHLGRRRAVDLLADVVGVRISLGALSAIEARVSEAVQPAVDEAWKQVVDAEIKHTDGTTWYQSGATMALWTLATVAATVFKIVADSTKSTLQPLYGTLQGILVSDRAKALNFWAMERRQIWPQGTMNPAFRLRRVAGAGG